VSTEGARRGPRQRRHPDLLQDHCEDRDNRPRRDRSRGRPVRLALVFSQDLREAAIRAFIST
jgi:hypothetical protein